MGPEGADVFMFKNLRDQMTLKSRGPYTINPYIMVYEPYALLGFISPLRKLRFTGFRRELRGSCAFVVSCAACREFIGLGSTQSCSDIGFQVIRHQKYK